MTNNVTGGCFAPLDHVGQKAQTFLQTSLLRSTHFLMGIIRSDRSTVPAMVADQLSHHPGWSEIDPLYISMKANHGLGGSKTYKVSAPSEACASPPEVAVHLCNNGGHTFAMSRVVDAAKVFAADGLAPTCLAHGSNFYIQAWEGNGTASLETLEDFQNLGCILSKIHALPTEWFDKHRSQLVSDCPALGRVPHGSHVWALIHPALHTQDVLNGMSEDVLQAFLDTPLTAPVNPIASRVVTCHIDLHHNNLLKADSGFMCIDFESACVTFAALDLALAMALAGFAGHKEGADALEFKRAVITSYLQEMGESSAEEQVEDIIFEAELARACYIHSALKPSSLGGSPKLAINLIEATQSFLCRARNSPDLRKRIIEVGFRTCAEEDDLLVLAWKARQEWVDRFVAGVPVPSGSTDAGMSTENDAHSNSQDSDSGWGLPLGCESLALPIGFVDAGL